MISPSRYSFRAFARLNFPEEVRGRVRGGTSSMTQFMPVTDRTRSRISSRSGKWTYVFFIDFLGHQADPLIRDVLERLSTGAVALKVLGSYPRAVL